ncbi:hypothetical protein J7L65_02050 [Candidatus Bathyarchaeota archaeon]|nr:hypothetical protein [Candidatus Bathyarchaeota archaeon]
MEGEEEREEERETEGELEKRIMGLEEGLRRLSENVMKTTSDLKETVSALRDAIVDIRSAISEIENPFNILRVITTEKDIEKLDRLKGVQPPPRAEQPPQQQEEQLEEVDVEAYEEPVEAAPPRPISLRGRFTILKWIWSLLDLGLEPEDINSLSEYCEHLGYLPEGSSWFISRLTPIVEKARVKGISVEELILNIYGAAAASGIALRPEDAMEAVFDALRLSAAPRCR